MVLARGLKEQAQKILMVILEWKERKFLTLILRFMVTLHLCLMMLMLFSLEMTLLDFACGIVVGCYTLQDLRKVVRRIDTD
jgi:hypothetical protein